VSRPTPFLERPLTSYYLLVGSSGLLLLIGLGMVLSASTVESVVDYGTPYGVFSRQVMWVALGLPAFWVALRLPVRAYRLLAYPLLLVTAGMLVAVLVPGVGVRVGGAVRWLDLGPVQVQPSEPAKLALALWGADLLVRKEKLLADWRHLLVPLLPVAVVFFALVMLEPDLGTTLCMVLVVFGLLWVAGAPLRLFLGLGGCAVAAIVVLIVQEPYRLRRVTGFLDPFADPGHTGYQAVQGLLSLSSGGWWGVGLGDSSAKWEYLPNAHTDFIFAILGEEFGFLGCLVVLTLFGTFAFAGIRIARRSGEPFVRLVSAAVTFWIVGQALINIGAVVALLPITGIPLPLISFGGSSLVLTMFIVGMLASFARAEPAAAAALAARGPSHWTRSFRLPHRRPRLVAPIPERGRRVTAGSRPARRGARG